MTLDSLDKKGKQFAKVIVDGYVCGKKQLKDGSNPYIDNAGIQVHSLFLNYDDLVYTCNISFYSTQNDDVEVCYVFSEKQIRQLPNESYNQAFYRFINIQRSELIYKISMLKWLYRLGYIFLVDDKRWNLFNTGKITEEDKKRWSEDGFKFHKEELRSKKIYDTLAQFHNCRIIPSPQLISYCDNGFKTPEQRRFRITSITAWIAIVVSILIGIGSSLFRGTTTTVEINSSQIESIIKTIQERNDEVKINQEQMDSIVKTLNNKQS